VRALGLDPVHDTRETFDGLLAAMSRPGTIHGVPAPADFAAVATLVDHEVTLATDDAGLRDALAEQGRLDSAPPEEADIVHAREHVDWDIRDCERGSRVEPSDGATVIYRVDALGDDDTGTAVTLSGPGIDGTATLSVGLPESELSAIATAQADFPRGVDVVFATADSVAALPRSVRLEVA
jgi:alpha-D-ribose 1-methylphosphonate 5-triphosphate synthase subunit PhnH